MRVFLIIIISLISCNSKIKEKGEMPQFIDKNIIYGSIEKNKLIYANWNKEVIIENLENNHTIFSQKTIDFCYMQPITKEDYIFFNYSNKEFRCVNYKTDKIIWEINTNNRPNRFHIINDSIGLLDIKHSGILKINLNNGMHQFILKYKYDNECSSPDLSPYPISFNSDYFIINDWNCKTIRCFNNSKEVWSINLSEGTSKSVLFENKVFVAVDKYYKSGSIFIIDLNSGKILTEFKNQHIMLRTTPVLWNNYVIFIDYYENNIKKYDFYKNEINTIKQFNDLNKLNNINNNFVVNQLILVNDFLYYQDNQFDVFRINLYTNKENLIGKSEKGGVSVVYSSKKEKEIIFY